MKTHKVLALFLSCLIFCQASQAQTQTQGQSQTPASTSAEDVRVARLAGLAKVWGAVKYFHPYLAYREIDWDKALVETLPKVNGAKTPQEYEAAVNQMLAVLNDRSTRAEIGPQLNTDEKAISTDTKYVWTETGVVVIDAAQIGTAIAKDTSTFSKHVASVTQALPNATGVVIDARSDGKTTDLAQFYFGVFMRRVLTAMLDSNVVLGSMRYRMHNGYATQTNSGSNSYSSSFVTSAPQVLQGEAKTKISLPKSLPRASMASPRRTKHSASAGLKASRSPATRVSARSCWNIRQ